MVTFLSNWIEQIALAVIIASIFEMILPKGNISKYIKMVLGVYIVFNIISPFVNSNALYNFSDLDVDSYVKELNMTSETNINQESMDVRLKKLYIEQIESNIKDKLDEMGFETKDCKVDAFLEQQKSNAGINRVDLILREKQNENDIKKVEVNEIVISKILKLKDEGNQEKINEIKKTLAEYYEIDESIINIKLK